MGKKTRDWKRRVICFLDFDKLLEKYLVILLKFVTFNLKNIFLH